ncbi:hypothetical protein Tco_0565461 [Tanacetum coccineum]
MSSSSSISYRRYNMNQDVTNKTHCECPHPIPVQILYDLHEENKALKRMNKMSGVMEDSSKQMSNNLNNQMVKDLKDDLTFVKSKLKVYDRLFFAETIVLSSDSNTSLESTSLELSSDPSIANVPTKGPSQELLKWYGYATYEETTVEDTTNEDTTNKDNADKDTTDKDTADKGTTDKDTTNEDTYDESYFPKFKGKNVQRAKKPTPTVIFKSPILIKGCVLGLANVQTWDNIEKFRIRKPGNCEDKGKGKRKV